MRDAADVIADGGVLDPRGAPYRIPLEPEPSLGPNRTTPEITDDVPLPSDNGPRLYSMTELDEITSNEAAGHLVNGLLPAGGVTLFVGKARSGKTTVVAGITAAIVTGHSFAGRTVKQKGVAVHVYTDRARVAEPKRLLRAALRGTNADPADTERVFWWRGANGRPPPSLLDGTHREELRKELDRVKASLVVVDSLRRSAPDWQENEADSTRLVMSALTDLTSGATRAVVAIHHAGHEQKRPRGSSDLDAAVESTIIVQPHKKARNLLILEAGHHGCADERFLIAVSREGEEDNMALQFSPVAAAPSDDACGDGNNLRIRAAIIAAGRTEEVRSVDALRKRVRAELGTLSNDPFDEVKGEMEEAGELSKVDRVFRIRMPVTTDGSDDA